MSNPTPQQGPRSRRDAFALGRRGFLGALGGAAATLSACTIGADAPETPVNAVWMERALKLKSNMVYTMAAPGIWAGKEGTHVPTVAIDGSRLATVSCTHAVAEGHWITTLFVEDQDGNVIHIDEFLGRGPDASQASTTFRVPAGVTSIVAYSYCNLHDCWSSASIPVG